MYVELIEVLRCPRCRIEGRESALVAAATRSDARHIVDGLLGCPDCGAEYPIEDGVTSFASRDHASAGRELSGDDAAVRTAALLDLTDARGFALLSGSWAVQARALHGIVETPLVLLNPPRAVAPEVGAATLIVGDVVPIAAGAARALALDSGSDKFAAWAAASVRVGGRVIGAANQPVPQIVKELARDENGWVGEKTAAPPAERETPRLVELKRAGR